MRSQVLLLPLLLILLLAADARAATVASGGRNDPGSLLIFPEVDARPGRMTFLTITNTNGSPTGAVSVHFIYVDSTTCLKADANALLTPFDTITVITGAHAPSTQRGFCYAYARVAGSAATFNHLVGSLMILDGTQSTEYGMNAMVFQGLTAAGTATDLDGDGIRDLNGLEYEAAPDRIAVPRFLGQLPPPGDDAFGADMIFVGLTGTRFSTSVDFLIFNDNEEAFSGSYTFGCWARTPLLSLSGAFSNSFLKDFTNHNPNEIIGLPSIESGWVLFDGGVAVSPTTSVVDPAFLAVLVERGRLSSSSLPFTLGTQTNAGLLSSTNSGNN